MTHVLLSYKIEYQTLCSSLIKKKDENEILNTNMEPQPSTSRILYDVPCSVCKDHSSGKHYGVFACDGCAGFFKRSVRRDRQYTCKARDRGRCLIDKTHRNQCRACRLNKCLKAGMNRDAVQHERGPRNSTIRRQMSLYFSEPVTNSSSSGSSLPSRPLTPLPTVSPHRPRVMPPVVPVPLFPYTYNPLGMVHPALLHVPRPPVLSPRPESPIILCLNLSDPNSMCESAARLLFLNVKWAKNVIRFDTLCLTDRMLLLRASWKNLFIIGSAQFMSNMNLRAFLNTDRSITLEDIKAYETVLAEFNRLRPTKEEYGCLKGYALFETRFEGVNEMQDPHFCANVQVYCDTLLLRYAMNTHPLEPADRAADIRSLIQLLSTVPSNVIVELFFRATIGEIPIEKIIVDMYTNSKMLD